MSIIDKITNLNLDPESVITLTFEEGTDVFHFNETEIETALAQTSVVSQLAELIATPKFDGRDAWGGDSILQNLRDQNFLENYERGGGYFSDYLTETINDNFYDVELIDYSTEKYDHKRGFTTLTATVKATVGNVLESTPFLSGWSVSVETENGVLTITD